MMKITHLNHPLSNRRAGDRLSGLWDGLPPKPARGEAPDPPFFWKTGGGSVSSPGTGRPVFRASGVPCPSETGTLFSSEDGRSLPPRHRVGKYPPQGDVL